MESNAKKLGLPLVIGVLLALALVATTGCSSAPEDEEAVGQSQDELAWAIPIVACLRIPPCASAVFLAIGYTVHTAQQILQRDRSVAYETAVAYERRERRRYTCTARCQANGAPSGAYYVEGTSNENCRQATLAAKATVPRGEYPRHCSCSDTDGYRGTGTQCEQHRR